MDEVRPGSHRVQIPEGLSGYYEEFGFYSEKNVVSQEGSEQTRDMYKLKDPSFYYVVIRLQMPWSR